MIKFFYAASLFLISGALAAQTPCVDGFAGDYPCSRTDLMSFMPTSDMGGSSNVNDIWGWRDVASGREFAIVGKSSGTAFVEITDPVNPVYLGSLPTHTTNSLWRDVKVYQNYAFIVSEAPDHGMQVFDLTQLLSVTQPQTFDETAHYAGFGRAHNIVINEETGYAYGVGTNTFSGGLHIINIQDPENPVIAGDFSEDGYTHDAQVVVYHGPDKDYCGKELAFACNENTFTIADVTDKADCQLVVASPYDETGYTHQGWLSEDHRLFFLGDELDEMNGYTEFTRTFVWDISDIDNPQLIVAHEGETTSIDHNLYTRWQLLFQSNYRSGLRILDGSKASIGELTEVAYFDVQPDDDNPSFSGSWSNYCYFPSGNVVVTDMYSGFFVLQPKVVSADYDIWVLGGQETATAHAYYSFAAIETEVLIEGLPSGVTATIGTINAPGTTNIDIEGLGGLAEGDYSFTIKVLYEGQQFTFDGVIHVQEEAIPFANAISPEGGDIEPGVTLTWESNVENAAYQVQVADDEAFTSIIFDETTAETSIEIPFDLPEGDYFWRVFVSGDCDANAESQILSFTVVNPIGVDEIERNALSVYPNPASDVLTVSAIAEGVEFIMIYAADGRLVEQFSTNGLKTMTIDLFDLTAGVYTIVSSLGDRSVFIRK